MRKIFVSVIIVGVALFLYFPTTRTLIPFLRPSTLSFKDEKYVITKQWDRYKKVLDLEYFPILETAANSLRDKKERLPGGGWSIHHFFVWVVPREADQAEWARVEKKLLRWERAFPESINPKIMLAQYWCNYVWYVDGRGYDGNSNKLSGTNAEKHLLKAREYLDATGEEGKRCPHYYLLKLKISLLLDEMAESQSIFDEATRRYPCYNYYYATMAFHLMPRWGGSVEEVHQFAEDMFTQTSGYQKYIIYNVIMGKIMRYTGLDYFFDMYDFNWERMKKGYEMRARYFGSSNYVNARYFVNAYFVGDKDAMRELLHFFDKHWDASDWKRETYVKELRDEFLASENKSGS